MSEMPNRNTPEYFEWIDRLVKETAENVKKGKRYSYLFDEKIKEKSLTVEVKKCMEVLKYIIKGINKLNFKPDIYKVLKILYFADRIHLPRYYKLITPDRYIKLKFGPVPSLCLSNIQFIRGDECHYNSFDEAIKKEIKVDKHNELKILAEPDLEYVSESDRECLDEAIAKYGNYSFNGLWVESCDEIYYSVPDINDEITIFHMADSLDKTGELTKKLHEIYSNSIKC